MEKGVEKEKARASRDEERGVPCITRQRKWRGEDKVKPKKNTSTSWARGGSHVRLCAGGGEGEEVRGWLWILRG
jgi:hypothetical protein